MMRNLVLVSLMAAAGTLGAVTFETTPEDVRAAAKALPQHPRLHVKGPEGLKAILESTTREVAFLRERCVKFTEGDVDTPFVVPVQEGRRLKGPIPARGIIVQCAAAYRFSGDRRFAKRAIAEMMSVCAWPSWSCEHYLDTAEILRGLAFGYDWLYGELTEDQRKTVRKAIIERGYAGMDNGKYCKWRHCRHNWCQSCWQAVVAAAIAIWEDDAERSSALVAEGIRAVAGAIDEYGPDGAYPEGPGYWNFGTECSCQMLHQLDTAFGTTFGLYEMPGFARTAEFALAAKGPTGLIFNYSDCGTSPSYVWYSPVIAYFASKAKRPEWMRLERRRLGHAIQGATVNPLHSPASLWTLLWMDFGVKDDPAAKPYPLDYIAHGPNPIAFLRGSYDNDAFFVGIKAGSVSVNHGNMDVGSFVLDRYGERWASDLGAEDYHRIESLGTINLWSMEQDSTRWTIFRQNQFAHNLLTVGGHRLKVAAKADIRVLETGELTRVAIDLGEVYGRDVVSTAVRGFALDRNAGAFTVSDALTGVRPGERVRWAMTTKAEKADIIGNRAILAIKDRRLTVDMKSATEGHWEFVDVSKGMNSWDSPNPGCSQLRWETSAPNGGKIALEACFR